MFQAMTTKYFGPTNHRGARIRVKAAAKTTFFPWDYALNPWDNHAEAMRQFAEKRHWSPDFIMGSLPCGGYVGVYADIPGIQLRADTLTRIG